MTIDESAIGNHPEIALMLSAWKLAVAMIALAACSDLHAQPLGPRDIYFFEQHSFDRWLHANQLHLYTPFRQQRTFTRLVPGGQADSNRMTLRAEWELRYRPYGPDSVRFTIANDGSFVGATAIGRPFGQASARTGADSTASADLMNYMNSPGVTPSPGSPARMFIMPAARVWEIFPVVKATTLTVGARWVDTLSLAASTSTHTQSLSGIRRSVIIGDTTLEGRQLWRVVDTTDATIVERFQEDELSIGARVVMERNARGTIRNRYLFDPELRLAIHGVDTASMTGTSTIRYPDGRTISSPVRFDRYRTSRLHSRAQYTARVQELSSAPEVFSDRGVQAGIPDLQRRLASGEPHAVDSIVAAYTNARTPIERQRAEFPVWARPVAGPLTARLQQVAISAGDTSTLLLTKLLAPQGWDVPLLRDLLIPRTADPRMALMFGVSRDLFYSQAVRLMIMNPPAINADTASWGFTPTVYNYFATLRNSTVDPRLRDVALLSLYVRDPARWADSVRARDRAGSAILEEAALIADGVGRAYRLGPKTPMPGSSAGIVQWREWLGGTGAFPPGYVRPLVDRSQPSGRGNAVLVAESHARAIRMFEMQTGRSVTTELRQRLAEATADADRALFTAILEAAGEVAVDIDGLAAALRSGDTTRMRRATESVVALFRAPPARGGGAAPVARPRQTAPLTIADSATRVEIMDHLVGIALGAGPVWADVDTRVRGIPSSAQRVESQRGRLNTVIVADSLPPVVVERWRERATLLTAAEWGRRNSDDLRRSYTISPIRIVGPFLNVRLSWSERLPPNRGGLQGHGGETNFYLMRLGAEWVVVHSLRAAS